MKKAALSLCHVLEPMPFVLGTIRPDLDPEAVPLALKVPLPLID
jgi:hypothetical protein